MKRRPGGRILTGGSLAALLLSAILIAAMYKYMLAAIGDFLVIRDQPQAADLIHVLGGNRIRGDYAAQLYRAGYSHRLLFTGETGGDGPPPPPDQVAKERALAQGVDPAALIPFTSTATSTYDEAVELKQILADRPDIHSVIIVSDSHHMRRVRYIFFHIIGHQRASLLFVPVPAELENFKQPWWSYRPSRQFISDEYLKLLYYIVKY